MKKNIDLMFKGKTIAITGGLGSIGSQIINKLLNYSPEQVLLLDNRETGLFYASEYASDERVNAFFCDVREKEQVTRMLKNVNFLFHAAAMKHLVVCENEPMEAVKTNIMGTENIIRMAKVYNVPQFRHLRRRRELRCGRGAGVRGAG